MKVTVLGTKYEVVFVNENDDEVLKEKDGYCDHSLKRIVVSDFKQAENDPTALGNLEQYRRQVIRHELIHAFLYESGLSCNSWARNEEMVDFFAIQFPKLKEAFEKNDILD